MRLTGETLLVLGALLDHAADEHFSLEIADAAGLPQGSIYPVLARLESDGWVESGWSARPLPTGRRRRFYRLTSDGLDPARAAIREDARTAPNRGLRLGGATA